MYQCIIPPRIFLAVGLGLLIVSLVLGWISFSVPDWLQFHERSPFKTPSTNVTTAADSNPLDDNWIDFKKFGLWYKCTFSSSANDFVCSIWNRDAPSFVRVAQVLIPFGLSLGCLSLLAAVIGFMSRRIFISAALFAALFAFLSFIFTTIGMTVFATESLVYVERLRLNTNENPRRWAMWLITPNIVLSFLASLCFTLASIFYWCDYRNMEVTGILTHSADKYGGSVFKAPSDSNMTTALKKSHQYLTSQPLPAQDYPNTCYQISGSHNNQNPAGYPPPPSYGAPSHQHGNNGVYNPAFQGTPGLFRYSRPPSPIFPQSNHDPYHHRHFMSENSEMDDLLHLGRTHRRSRSRGRSGARSRSHSPRDSAAVRKSTQESNTKQPQFIPIPVPYFQTPVQPPTSAAQPTSQPAIQAPNATASNSTGNNPNSTSNPPMTYVIQPPPKQQFFEEILQSQPKATNMLTYGANQPSLVMSNPTQPVYTIAYRANNGGGVLASNILSGPAAATYVTAARNHFAAVNTFQTESDPDEKDYRAMSRRQNFNRINPNEAWTWRKL